MKLTVLIDRSTRNIGRSCAWLVLSMVLVTFVIVVLRYAFDSGWIWLQESVIWMHAAVFMLAAAYTLARDEHVRVDIFYRHFDRRKKALVDAIGTLIFLVPVSVFFIWSSWEYVSVSWQIRETSVEAGGLIFPLLPVMKAFIPVMSGLLLLQAISLLHKAWAIFFSDSG